MGLLRASGSLRPGGSGATYDRWRARVPQRDGGNLSWVAAHPSGYVINIWHLRPKDARLHHACRTISVSHHARPRPTGPGRTSTNTTRETGQPPLTQVVRVTEGHGLPLRARRPALRLPNISSELVRANAPAEQRLLVRPDTVPARITTAQGCRGCATSGATAIGRRASVVLNASSPSPVMPAHLDSCHSTGGWVPGVKHTRATPTQSPKNPTPQRSGFFCDLSGGDFGGDCVGVNTVGFALRPHPLLNGLRVDSDAKITPRRHQCRESHVKTVCTSWPWARTRVSATLRRTPSNQAGSSRRRWRIWLFSPPWRAGSRKRRS
jgi:hypothetical protein